MRSVSWGRLAVFQVAEGHEIEPDPDGEGLGRHEPGPGLVEVEGVHAEGADLDREAELLPHPARGQKAGQQVLDVPVRIGALGLSLDVLEREIAPVLDLAPGRKGEGQDERRRR